jgi:hypothetical protein
VVCSLPLQAVAESETVIFVTVQEKTIVFIVQTDTGMTEEPVHSVMVMEKAPVHSVMEQESLTNSQTTKKLVYTGSAHLILGGLIYILFRDTNQIIFFRYFDINYGQLFSSEFIPDFIIYQVPDMLWAGSFLLFTKAIDNSIYFSIILFLWFIVLEVSQLFWDWGTFDILDIIAICIPFVFVFRKQLFRFSQG